MKNRIIEWIEDHIQIFPVLVILAGIGLIFYGALYAGHKDTEQVKPQPSATPKIDSSMLVEWQTVYETVWFTPQSGTGVPVQRLYIGSKVPNPDSVYRKRMEIRDSTTKAQREAEQRKLAIQYETERLERERGYIIENGARIYNRIPQ